MAYASVLRVCVCVLLMVGRQTSVNETYQIGLASMCPTRC